MVKLPQLIGIFAIVQLVIFAGFTAYNLRENSKIREETRQIVEAESLTATTSTINSVLSKAEAARAVRRLCLNQGKQYDFETNSCR